MAIYPDKKGKQLTGRWRVEVQLNGHRLRGRFDTIEEARQKDAEWKRQLAAGDTSGATHREDLRSGPKTLSQLLAKAVPMIWNGSDHGLDAQRKVLAIIQHIGDIRLSALDTGHIDAILLKLRELGKSPATINRYLSALHAVLAWGHKPGRGYVPVMPEFQWQDEDEGRIRVITPAEERRLVELLTCYGREDIAAFLQVAIDTGCRRGELHSARRDQLIPSSPRSKVGWLKLHADQTKGKRTRAVPLTPRAERLLEEHLPWDFELHTLRHYWERAKAEMGLAEDEDFVLHACRHTCATRLVAKGVNLRVIQTYMGHRAIQTTLRYAHTNDDMLVMAAARLAEDMGEPVLQSQMDPGPVSAGVGAEDAGAAWDELHPHPTATH
jgi:integrase